MSTVLDQTTAAMELADLWESDAERVAHYDADDPTARVLKRCSEDLRRVLGEMAPEWVPIRTVHATTGRSLASLRRIAEELTSEGKARKRRGRWEIALDAALGIRARRDRVDVSGVDDPGQLARMLGRDPG